jgi:hypothetical protein
METLGLWKKNWKSSRLTSRQLSLKRKNGTKYDSNSSFSMRDAVIALIFVGEKRIPSSVRRLYGSY